MTDVAALDCAVALRLGALDLNVALRAQPGETVAVLGPNGAGKSTFLRALAGLVPIESGWCRLGDVVLDDVTARISVPAERRPVSLVFQDHALFPRMTVLDNVAFGLRARGTGRRAARDTAATWLQRVGLAGYESRRPRELSGGEAQRVALARALVLEPALLLLDEPLSALDASTRIDVRRQVRRHIDSFNGVTVVVTHDPVDAAALAHRFVIFEGGRVVQTGTPPEISARPRSRYVADLVGLNMIAGRAAGGRIVTPSGFNLLTAEDADGDVLALIHPRAVTLHRARPDSTARNAWPATVEDVDLEGDRVRVRTGGPVAIVAEVTPTGLASLGLSVGSPVWVSVKATEIGVVPA